MDALPLQRASPSAAQRRSSGQGTKSDTVTDASMGQWRYVDELRAAGALLRGIIVLNQKIWLLSPMSYRPLTVRPSANGNRTGTAFTFCTLCIALSAPVATKACSCPTHRERGRADGGSLPGAAAGAARERGAVVRRPPGPRHRIRSGGVHPCRAHPRAARPRAGRHPGVLCLLRFFNQLRRSPGSMTRPAACTTPCCPPMIVIQVCFASYLPQSSVLRLRPSSVKCASPCTNPNRL